MKLLSTTIENTQHNTLPQLTCAILSIKTHNEAAKHHNKEHTTQHTTLTDMSYPEAREQVHEATGLDVVEGSQDLAHVACQGRHDLGVAVIQGFSVTAIQGNSVTAIQGNSVTAIEGNSVTAIEGNSVTAMQGYSVTAIQGNSVAAAMCNTAIHMLLCCIYIIRHTR